VDFQLTDTQAALRDRVRKFAQDELKPKAAYWDENETFPVSTVARAAELGFLGLLVPKKYGGQELGPIEAIIAIEEMAKACAVTAEVVFDCILGPIQVIQHFGTDAQRERYLRRAATGEILMGIAISDRAPPTCTAEPSSTETRWFSTAPRPTSRM